jgi:hypothetical protein
MQLPESAIRIQPVYPKPISRATGNNYLFYTDTAGSRKFGPSQRVQLVPKYTFNMYGTRLEFNHHLDSALEQGTEIAIDLKVTHGDSMFFDKHWDLNVVTNTNIGPALGESRFPVFFELAESHLSYEISLTDSEGIMINFIQSEHEILQRIFGRFSGKVKDVFSVNFDGCIQAEYIDDGFPRGIHPARLLNRGAYTYSIILDVQDGYFSAHVKTDMTLMVRLDRSSSLVTTT